MRRGVLGFGLLLWLLLASSAAAQEGPERPLLTLDAALTAARVHQPELRAARADVEAAEARSDQARSGLLPQLRASASYRLSAGPSSELGRLGATTEESTIDLRHYYDAGVSVSQLIWDFGQTLDRRRASAALAAAQRDTEEASALSVALDVRLAYFAAAARRALVGVAEASLDNQRRHLGQVEAFVEAERQPAIDLAQARAEVANARVALIQAENDYELAKVELNRAMGVEDEDTDYDVALDAGLALVAGEEAPPDELVDEALRVRPEMAATADRLLAQELSVEAGRAAFWPSVSISSGLSESGSALDELQWGWNVGVSLDWRFYQGGATRAQVRETEANLEGLSAQRDLLEHAIRVEVQRGRLAVRSAAAVVEAADDVVVNARERLRLAEGRYAAGAGSIIELNDAQLALVDAEVQRIQADFDLATARAQLVAALGRE